MAKRHGIDAGDDGASQGCPSPSPRPPPARALFKRTDWWGGGGCRRRWHTGCYPTRERDAPSSSIDPENCAAHSVSIVAALGVWRVVRDAPDGASSDGNNEGAAGEKNFSTFSASAHRGVLPTYVLGFSSITFEDRGASMIADKLQHP